MKLKFAVYEMLAVVIQLRIAKADEKNELAVSIKRYTVQNLFNFPT